MPSTEIELCHGYESLHRVFHLGNRKKGLGVCHEANRPVSKRLSLCLCNQSTTHFVMRSSIDRGSRIKVGSVTRLKSAPGRSCDMMCVSTAR